MKNITLKIDKMHCSSCAIRIDGDLEDAAGIRSAQTDYYKAQTTVEYDENLIDLDKIKQVISAAGYEVIQ